ncbi:N-acetylmuramidase family protein [Photobacterium chitinilyticum]|uniref:N-acetylmuramidase family protein n=1 Tax=Photobacterium chitinilyticum TaxID=2485123 RepID=A0A444JVG9_9GAMM|nr:N-acetylmuramidase family protein [Photobacterium chitinilyticum]RWX57057.1 N-acetylmuramidase family protein [Photobacterium chitinilyticum]
MKQLALSASVGDGGVNKQEDIRAIQQALNCLKNHIGLSELLSVDGSLGQVPSNSNTVKAICSFQRKIMGFSRPDGRVDCWESTHKAINELLQGSDNKAEWFFPSKVEPQVGLAESDYQHAAELLSCDIAAIKAVSDVESAGKGFLPDGLPCILFEAHQFSKFTDHQYDSSQPAISSRKWNRSLYKGGEAEYPRLKQAIQLDRTAALKSASWGRYQIMGFNHKSAGYLDVESYVQAMFESERNHLIAFVYFIKSDRHLLSAIQNHQWEAFARHYNGPSYQTNHYDEKLRQAYEKHSIA